MGSARARYGYNNGSRDLWVRNDRWEVRKGNLEMRSCPSYGKAVAARRPLEFGTFVNCNFKCNLYDDPIASLDVPDIPCAVHVRPEAHENVCVHAVPSWPRPLLQTD